MISTVLCTDIGSSSLKTALLDKRGAVISYTKLHFDKLNLENNNWLDYFIKATNEVISKTKENCQIQGICVSGNGPTVVSETGKTLLWNDISEIEMPYKTQSLFIPRLYIHKRKYLKDWEKSKYIFSGPEYLIWKLTGEAVTILPDNRYIPAYWTKENLDSFEIDYSKLPNFVKPSTMVGLLKNDLTEKMNINKVPVFAGAPDFIVALLGTNTLSSGSICDRAGSSEGINLCLDINPLTKNINSNLLKDIRILPGILPNMYNLSYLIPDSGIRFSSYKKSIAPEMSYEDFVISLLKKDTTNNEGFVLMCEIGKEVKQGLDRLEKICLELGYKMPYAIRTSGGQAQNHSWLSFKSTIINYPIEVTTCADSELTGNSILAWYGLKEFDSIQQAANEIVKISKTFYPNPSFL